MGCAEFKWVFRAGRTILGTLYVLFGLEEGNRIQLKEEENMYKSAIAHWHRFVTENRGSCRSWSYCKLEKTINSTLESRLRGTSVLDIVRNSKTDRAHVLYPTYSTHGGQQNHVANQWLPECMSCRGYVHMLSAQLSWKSCYTGDAWHQPRRADDAKLQHLPRACKVESVHEIPVPICWRFLLVEQPSNSYCQTSRSQNIQWMAY